MPLKTCFFYCLLLGSSLWSSNACGQQTSREVGLYFGGLNSFNFIYKVQRSENTFKRVRLAAANLSFSKLENFNRFAVQLGIAVGREKRQAIAQNLQWYHGWEPGFVIGYDLRDQENSPNNPPDSWEMRFEPFIGYVLGFQYRFSERFYLAAEGIPSLRADFALTSEGVREGFLINSSFSFNFVTLTLAHAFTSTTE